MLTPPEFGEIFEYEGGVDLLLSDQGDGTLLRAIHGRGYLAGRVGSYQPAFPAPRIWTGKVRFLLFEGAVAASGAFADIPNILGTEYADLSEVGNEGMGDESARMIISRFQGETAEDIVLRVGAVIAVVHLGTDEPAAVARTIADKLQTGH